MALEPLEGRSLMATLTWDGNNGNGSNYIWSAWSNWSPDRVPQNGDTLVFAGNKKLTHSNNMSGLSIPQVNIQSNGFNIDGHGIALGSGGIHLVGGTSSTFGLPLAISAAATPVDVSGSRTLNLTDVISGPGGVAKSGSGTAILHAANTFAGNTQVGGGTLRLNAASALQQSTLDYNNHGGNLSFGTLASATLGGLAGSQNLSLSNASGTSVALTVGANGQNTMYAGVLSGSGGLTKSGSGMLTLTGANTYSGGTTVTAGTLAVIGSLLNSNVVVNAGGILLGTGTVQGLDLNGGVVSPGIDFGTLTVSAGAILDAGTVDIKLNDGVTVNWLEVTSGDVTLGADLNLSADISFSPSRGSAFVLVDNAGTGATTGEFAGYAHGSMVTLNGLQLELRYGYDFGGDGNANDVVLIRPVNGIPLAADDQYSVVENGSLTVNAPGTLANDSDPDGDPLTVSGTLIQPPAHGTVTFAADGSFVYTPHANFSGLDNAMIYQVDDGQGGLAQASVIFTVTPANVPPVIGVNVFRTVESHTMLGALKATDVDSPTLTFAIVAGPASGSVNLDPADGKFSYTSAAVPSSTIVTFTFSVTDGQSTAQGTATITVLNWNGQGIRPDVLAWMLDNNPGLQANFLRTELPDRVVLLPNGQSLPIYRLQQFLDVNFQLNFKSRVQEKVGFVESQETHLRKLMALPEFYYWIKNHSNTYRIAGRGTVTSEQAYNFFRNIHRNIWVTASSRVRAPVGGGNGINAPSWAVWQQMNIFFHEACHVIGIGHNSGGLSGPLAGKLRDWDRQQRWNYSTIDLNSLSLPRQ
jgi:autotransporter-associated beta strand protein